MYFQFNQCRPGKRPVSKEERQHVPSGRGHKPVKGPVFLAHVGCLGPASDYLSCVIKTAKQAIVIEVEYLLTTMGWNIGRECHL